MPSAKEAMKRTDRKWFGGGSVALAAESKRDLARKRTAPVSKHNAEPGDDLIRSAP